jgi:RNase P subunit RPR2
MIDLEFEITSQDNEIIAICSRYWQTNEKGEFVETVTAIAKEYGASVNDITKRVQLNSRAYSKRLSCQHCGVKLFFESRASYTVYKAQLNWACNECKEKQHEIENHKKLDLLLADFEKSLESPIIIESLNARQALFLLGLLKFAINEEMTEINEYESNRLNFLSPTVEFDLKILNELFDAKIIRVSYLSNLETITLKENNYSFYISKVKWLIPFDDKIFQLASFYNDLEARIKSQGFIENHFDEIVLLCQEISKIECLAYLDRTLAQNGLTYSYGEKTHAVITHALENFSVAQVYNFIWRSAKDATGFHQQHRVSKDHAAKTVVGSIERQAERALANQWEIKPFTRHSQYPQSILSRILFNHLLGTNDGGFYLAWRECFTQSILL